MTDLADHLATSNRSMSAASIWIQVRDAIQQQYGTAPVYRMRKEEIISRVENQRHGGRRADRLQDVENPNLALSTNGMSPFLCFNTPVYDPSGITQHRVIGWSHSGLRRVLRYPGVHLFIDATFKVVPEPFKQLLVIMAKDAGNDMYVPVFHILMTGKTTYLYKFTLSLCVAVLGSNIGIATVTCDFEKALMQAVKGMPPGLLIMMFNLRYTHAGVFGNETVIIGCLFHWKQANRRRLIGLKVSDDVISRLMKPGMLDILTVIAHDEIATIGFEFIRDQLQISDDDESAAIEAFFEYFRSTWMNQYSPNDWNIHRYINNEEIANRTNNALETYHGKFNRLFTHAHPNLLDFVERLRSHDEQIFQDCQDCRADLASPPRHGAAFIPDSRIIPDEYRAFRSRTLSFAVQSNIPGNSVNSGYYLLTFSGSSNTVPASELVPAIVLRSVVDRSRHQSSSYSTAVEEEGTYSTVLPGRIVPFDVTSRAIATTETTEGDVSAQSPPKSAIAGH
jgi:hypothetical protein